MLQPSLLDPPKELTRADQIYAAFKEFHAANPDIWRLFVRFTNDAIAAGRTHFSTDAVVQRIRWETDVVVKGGEGVKFNNNFRAYYGRMFEAAYPEHGGFFRARVRISAEEPAREEDRQVFIDPQPEDESGLMAELASLAEGEPK